MTYLISFGYRCSVASILKKHNLRQESLPFDWLISRLHVIKDCIETNFNNFLKIENYEKRHTNTYSTKDANDNFICDEFLNVNLFYQPIEKHNEENTYQYHLAMNHHNIFDEKDHLYYQRSIERFNGVFYDQSKRKTYIHIYPLALATSSIRDTLEEIQNFHSFLLSKTTNINGIFFILMRGDKSCYLSEKIEFGKENYISIYVIKTNPHFFDAGSIFMGNSHEETEMIENIILSLV